jgi:hypothetical protein
VTVGVLTCVLLAANATVRIVADDVGPENAVSRAQRVQRVADVVRVDPHLYHQASVQWAYAAQVDPAVAASRPDEVAIVRAMELDPRYHYYALERGRTAVFYQDPTADVIETHEAVVDLYATSPEANARLANEAAIAGDDERAREHLGIVTAQRPLDVVTLDLVAEAYGYLGEEELAAQYRRQAEDARALSR